jgi:tight adherence protein C
MLLLPALAFLFGSLLVAAVALALAPRSGATIEQRLGEVTGSVSAETMPQTGYAETIAGGLKRLGKLGPKSASEMGKLQQRLIVAGYRNKEALIVFSGVRVTAALAGFVVCSTPLLVTPNLSLALIVCVLGYVVPGMILARMAKARQHKMRNGLPDALDLLVVSVEAGLGLDQALQRVGQELAFAHPELCEELRLVNLELRAGKARSEALHNLGTRTGLDDVISLVAMLVQTDKFGTSVAQSLRRQRAEEAAAKTGVKMVFPLVLCIFPAIWIVTIGPAALKFIEVLGPLTQK